MASTLSASSVDAGFENNPGQVWQLRRVDMNGSHTWKRSASSQLVELQRGVMPSIYEDIVLEPHVEERTGLALLDVEKRLVGCPGEEEIEAERSFANPLSELEHPQNFPVQGQCASVVDWLQKHGVPLSSPTSMSAADIQHGLMEPLREAGAIDTARKLPAALVVATGKEIVSSGTQLSRVLEFSVETAGAMRSTSPTLDSPSSRASPTSNRAPTTIWNWTFWMCWPWCGNMKRRGFAC